MSFDEKIWPLESLRGFAALSVLLCHCIPFLHVLPSTSSFMIQSAALAVNFFFVLSGYVIALNYREKISSLENFYLFQIRRFLRLYPLHLLTFSIILMMELLKYWFPSDELGSLAFSKNNFLAGVHTLFLTQGFLLDNSPYEVPFNGPSWSISVEFYTYFLFGVLSLLFRRHLKLGVYLFLAISSGLCYELLAGRTFCVQSSLAFVRCMMSFFLGASLSFISIKKRNSISTPTFIGTLMGILYLATFPSFPIPHIGVSLLFCVLILASIKTSNTLLRNILSHRYLVYLGTLSYGIYMWHYIVIMIVTWFLKRIGFGVNSGVLSLGGFEALFVISIIILITLCLSWFSYKNIERPVIQKSKEIIVFFSQTI